MSAVALQFGITAPVTGQLIKVVFVNRPPLADIIALENAGEDALLGRACGLPPETAAQFTQTDRANIRAAWARLPV